MKELLNNIKAKLKTEMPCLKAVTIIPDPYLFPVEAGFPQIGLVDNGENIAPEKTLSRTEHLYVQICLYQAVIQEEKSIMGDGRNPGLLDMAADVGHILRNELFGVFYNVTIKGKSKSQALTQDMKGFIAHKTIDLDYGRARQEEIT